MPYIIAFGLLLAGYTVALWGHYVAKSERVSMWYLISGKGPRNGGSVADTINRNIERGPSPTAGGGYPSDSGGGSW